MLEGGAGRVKITDFGLARAADDASISQSGIIAGTPMYMAPEQARAEKLDQRADLFSLGSVLYQMAAGRPPFRANNTPAVLKRVAEDAPRDIREIISETPKWLCDIIAKLLAKDPAERYQSAREVADVLADCEAQLKEHAKLTDYSRIPACKPAPARPVRGRRKWVAAAGVIALLACGVVWAGPYSVRYFANRGDVEFVPGPGLGSVIVLQNDVIVHDWMDLRTAHQLTLPPGMYELNMGLKPGYDYQTSGWEVEVSGLFSGSKFLMSGPSLRLTLTRGERATIRVMAREAARAGPSPPPSGTPPLAIAPFDAMEARAHQEAWAKHLGVPVEFKNTFDMPLRVIPPGKFTMGSPEGEIERCLKQDSDGVYLIRSEAPEHEVEIVRPFYLGATEVTVGQFRRFVEGSNYSVGNDGWKKPSHEQFDDYPVVFLTWQNAADFCSWLSRKEGKKYRLPTEAEWEYCCRAGKGATRHPFGDNDTELEDYCWYVKNSGGGPKAVANKKPNEWGLYDMLGNAWEWCEDSYDPHYYRRSPKKDPSGGAGDLHVIRGGAWNESPVACRSACRHVHPEIAGVRWGNHGFRVVLDVSPLVSTGSGTSPQSPPAIAPFTDADVKQIAALPPVEQVEEVRKELMRRNPGFDGKVEHKIEGGIVTEIRLLPDKVTDISPIRVWSTLQVLHCHGAAPHGLLMDLTTLGRMNLAGLRGLDLQYTNVNDTGMVYFKDSKNLTYLNLFDTQVSDAGMAYFKDCKALTHLYLCSTKVGDAGMAYFKDCKNLTVLCVHRTQVGDAGMICFQDCKALTELNVAGTKVTDAGLVHFKDCKSLKHLYLDRTHVGDAGLAQFKGLPLTKLAIENTAVTDLTPLQGMPLEEIHLTPKTIARGLSILRGMKSLKTIGLEWPQSWPAAEFWDRYDKGEFK
jgi:formylglycine-generating enzyme required for sulfatase activity